MVVEDTVIYVNSVLINPFLYRVLNMQDETLLVVLGTSSNSCGAKSDSSKQYGKNTHTNSPRFDTISILQLFYLSHFMWELAI